MGGCLSYNNYESRRSDKMKKKKAACASVVLANGQLRQYPVPITVSQVLLLQSSSDQSFFLCNSDRLFFDEYIPALESHEQLQQGQIYFVLPTTKLKYRLAASDMAALAVKASVALQQINPQPCRSNRNKKSRISPYVLVMAPNDQHQLDQSTTNHHQVVNNNYNNESKITSSGYYNNNNNNKKLAGAAGISRSGSVRNKLSRYSSRRAKMAVRSFRIKLSTINEGSVLLSN